MPDDRQTTELAARLTADEQRLLTDEARLEADEARTERSRFLSYSALALAASLAIAVTALVFAVLALRQDVGTLGRDAADASVGTDALRTGSVTADKLGPGAVGPAAVAPGAIGPAAVAAGAIGSVALAPDAVTSAQVAANTLTGADLRESTLGRVPVARDAQRLGGAPARAYVTRPRIVTATSTTDAHRIKGPVVAACPPGARVLSGGAAIHGAVAGASLVRSEPEGAAAWTATARVARTGAPRWRLEVSAVCADGGA